MGSHKSTIRKKYDNLGQPKNEDQIIRENFTFAAWFKDCIRNKPLPTSDARTKIIFALAHGPTCNIMTYQAYDINGYTFYMEAKDKDSEDLGVTMESFTGNVRGDLGT